MTQRKLTLCIRARNQFLLANVVCKYTEHDVHHMLFAFSFKVVLPRKIWAVC